MTINRIFIGLEADGIKSDEHFCIIKSKDDRTKR